MEMPARRPMEKGESPMPAEILPWLPWIALIGFFASTALMLWRLEAMSADGFQGTVLGTLITPYCSGLGNLVFVIVMLRQGGEGSEILINCLVNNATNLTLLLGLPALLWALAVIPAKRAQPRSRKARQQLQLSRLSLLLTLVAAGFFTAIMWMLGRDGTLDRGDGWTLIALFLFWQSYSVYEVLRDHVSQKQAISPRFLLDGGLLLVAAAVQYWTIDFLVGWVVAHGEGLLSAGHLGWLSGWLMVTPNALLALYYARQNKPDIVYSSQIGDGHICIPLCLGLFAAFRPITVPAFLTTAALVLGGALLAHFIFVALLGRLPRWGGLLLLGVYGAFCYFGLA